MDILYSEKTQLKIKCSPTIVLYIYIYIYMCVCIYIYIYISSPIPYVVGCTQTSLCMQKQRLDYTPEKIY